MSKNHIYDIIDLYLKHYNCLKTLSQLSLDNSMVLIKFATWIHTENESNIDGITAFSDILLKSLFMETEVRKLTFTLLPLDMKWSDCNVVLQYKRLVSAKLLLEHDAYISFRKWFVKEILESDNFLENNQNYKALITNTENNSISNKLKELWV